MIEFEEEETEAGAPPWMATFADLMSLLVCFFVLLLSFSEIDLIKYQQLVGSMKDAFGVQRRIEAESIPKGTSVIAQEFSPGTPRTTPLPIINQQTTDDSRRELQTGQSDALDEPVQLTPDQLQEVLERMLSASRNDVVVNDLLSEGITDGKLDIEMSSNQVRIRIKEQGSFTSGSADLSADFLPFIDQLKLVLDEMEGTISVEGHTDNVPIQSDEFESNWDLSARRALSVARELMKGDTLQESRFMVVGHADTRPFMPNDTAENRAANRRVEIIIRGEITGDSTRRNPEGANDDRAATND